MRHSSSTLEALHKLSSRNRDALRGAHPCGCFYCLKAFEAGAITEWIPEADGKEVTALCPFCGIDSVLPARGGQAVDQEMLKAMQIYWFEGAVSVPAEGSLLGRARLRLEPLLRRLRWDLWRSRKDIS
jgi:hypothetical protein